MATRGGGYGSVIELRLSEARTWSGDATRIPRILGVDNDTARRNNLRINMALTFQCGLLACFTNSLSCVAVDQGCFMTMNQDFLGFP